MTQISDDEKQRQIDAAWAARSGVQPSIGGNVTPRETEEDLAWGQHRGTSQFRKIGRRMPKEGNRESHAAFKGSRQRIVPNPRFTP